MIKNYIKYFLFFLFIHFFNQSYAQTLPTGIYTIVEADKGIAKIIEGEQTQTYYLSTSPSITIADFKKVKLQKDPQTYGKVILLAFTEAGKNKFATLSEENLKKPLGFVIGNKLMSCPIVQQKIDGGKVIITHGYEDEKLFKKIAKELKKEIKNNK